MDLNKPIDPKETSKVQKDQKDSRDAKEATSNDQASGETATTQADKLKQFEGEGVTMKAKLIGSELVLESRGDKMCQNSIQRLKAIIKGTYSHKKRILLKISYSGVKVFDEKTNEVLHHHEVPEISYIASDDTDQRCFGYVCDVPGKLHQFICFKTTGPAMNVMSIISALFEAVLEKKESSERQKKQESLEKSSGKSFESRDLISDSGIAEGDSSFASINLQSQQTSGPSMGTTGKPSSSADLLFDDLFSGLSTPVIVDKDNSMVSYSMQQPQQTNQGPSISIQRPRPSVQGDASQPIAMPTALQRPTSMAPNRSLVYNHSSASLGEGATLSRQSSFASPPVGSFQNQQQTSSHGPDKYSVFNEIDNLPSIFESTSLGSNTDVPPPNTRTGFEGAGATSSGSASQSYQQQLRNGLMLGQRSFSSANMAPLVGQQSPMDQMSAQQQQHFAAMQQQQPLVGSYPNQQGQFKMAPHMLQQQMAMQQQQQQPLVYNQQLSRHQQFAALNHQLNSSMGAAGPIADPWNSGNMGHSLGNQQSMNMAVANRMFSQSFNHDQRGFVGGLAGGPPTGPAPQLAMQPNQRQQSMQMPYQQQQPPPQQQQGQSQQQQQQQQSSEVQQASGSLMFKQKNPFDDDFFA